ncbi:hypothetical protein GPICK_04310 [Geobacter pickeringii]|uniref:Proteinase inhibitor I42 chagasin domain-containing protein n=1 Tax=Geobacter pickeringii TaxID=345632 RepID=A0A0B5BI13_9BACT|nr:hypothetical protein GPICK_04310 [Geobacter pickeringii]
MRLAVGETHRLRLTGRGSAGYGWEMSVTGDGEAVRVTKEFLPLPPTLPTGGPLPPGYSRDEEVVITALAPGTATVRLVQRRAWEREKPPLKELLLGVRVTGRAGGAD